MRDALDAVRRDAIAQSKNKEVGCINEVFEMIDEVIQISVTARTYGLLALEEYIEKKDKDALHARELKLLGMLIVDATAPELVEETLVNRYWVRAPKGYHALHLFGYIYGMLMVQQGEHPRMIKTMLTSLLEDEDAATYEQYFEEHPEIMKPEKKEKRSSVSEPESDIGELFKVDVFTEEELAFLLSPTEDNEDE